MLKRFKDTIKNTKSKIPFDFDDIKEKSISLFDERKIKFGVPLEIQQEKGDWILNLICRNGFNNTVMTNLRLTGQKEK